MASVTFLEAVGGDGSTVDDTTSTTTGLDGRGYVERFVPALSQVVAVAGFTVTTAGAAATSAAASAASASSALNAPGTNATSTTSLAIATGSKAFTIQTGKAYAVGQTLVAASAADPSNYMAGQVTAHNSGTGALTINVTQTGGSGTKTDWVISMAAIVSSTLPTQTGNDGKVLGTNGTTASWVATLAPANNLSELASAATARTNLGLAIGTNVQAYDAGLQSISGLTTAANKMIYTTASDTYAVADLTAAGRALLDDADAAAQRTTLGLVIGTNVQAYSANLGALSGLTLAADKLPYATGAGAMALTDLSSFARTLIDDTSAGAARSTLGAAASGANNDITSLSAVTTPLTIAQGGTNSSTAAAALSNLFGAYTGNPGATVQVNTAADGMVYKKRAKAKWIMSGSTISSQTTENCTVSRTDTGDFTITFTNAMDDANYVVSGSARRAGSGDSMIFSGNRTSTDSTSAAYITLTTQAGSPDDPSYACVIIEAI